MNWIGEDARWIGNSQNTEGENEGNGDFFLCCHLDGPDHRNWHDGVHPISDDGQNGDRVRCSDEGIPGHTFGVLDGEIPLRLHGRALEDFEEEDGEGPDRYDYHADFQGPSVAFLGCNPEEEDCDAELNKHHICNIGGCCKSLVLMVSIFQRRWETRDFYLKSLDPIPWQ